MSEQEQTTTDQVTADETPSIRSADVRKHPLFEKLTSDLAAQKQALADMQSAQSKAEEDRKLAELEKSQNWDALKAELQGKHERERAEIESKLVQERLTNKLVVAGITHPFAITAALQQYTPGEQNLDEFVETFAQSPEVQALLKPETPTAALPGGDASAGTPRSTDNNWVKTLEDKHSGDPKRMMAAAQAVKAYMIANNGKRPPGF